MIERGRATEDNMVAAFLRAEINSSRYDDHILAPLRQQGLSRRLIDEPNLADAAENVLRKRLLDFRGFRVRNALFTRFPMDAQWRRVTLEPDDLGRLRYANYPTWVELSGGTRLVNDGARNFRGLPDEPNTHHICAIAEACRNGIRFPELITAEAHDGSLILIEGHSRATAYLMEGFTDDIEALVASSPTIHRWEFY
jgi:hypothetical protein